MSRGGRLDEPGSVRRCRVLIVDDHAAFRAALRAMLDEASWCTVVGEAGDGEEAVALAGSLRADLVLMDVRLPGISGIEASRRIRSRPGAALVVLVSTVPLTDLPPGVSECGAVGFLAKDGMDPEALHALVASG